MTYKKDTATLLKCYKWVCLDCHITPLKRENIYCTELAVKDSYKNKIMISAIPVFHVILKCTIIVVVYCSSLAQINCCSIVIDSKPLMKVIIWVTGVLRRTVVGDWRFDNLCISHQQQSFSGLQSPRWSLIFQSWYVTPGFKPLIFLIWWEKIKIKIN